MNTAIKKYPMLNSSCRDMCMGWIGDGSLGAASNTCSIWSQRNTQHNRKTIMMTNTVLAKTPWMKSVTMIAIWPPKNVNTSAIDSKTAMIVMNVEHEIPKRLNESGKPQIAIKNRAPTAG